MPWQDYLGRSSGSDSSGKRLILPRLRLAHRAGRVFAQSGIDSPESCIDIQHFKNYPFEIEYRHNSRGFRDEEWPADLADAIWCVGDSFTVGIGQPLAHIWPQVLDRQSGKRTINFSMDGASNNWIARRTLDIIEMINPRNIVILWSYVERRERIDLLHLGWQKIYDQIRDPSWPTNVSLSDLDRLPDRIKDEIYHVHGIDLEFFMDCNDALMIYQDARASDQDNFENWCHCIDLISDHAHVIHGVIPDWVPSDRGHIKYWNYLEQHVAKKVRPFTRLDWARDGHHFDLLTSEYFVSQVLPLLI